MSWQIPRGAHVLLIGLEFLLFQLLINGFYNQILRTSTNCTRSNHTENMHVRSVDFAFSFIKYHRIKDRASACRTKASIEVGYQFAGFLNAYSLFSH